MDSLPKIWKIIIVIIYLSICIIDFIVIPNYILKVHKRQTSYAYYEKISEIFKNDPESIRIILSDRKPGDWTPFSLRSGALFHISFGTIITGSIIGKRKKE